MSTTRTAEPAPAEAAAPATVTRRDWKVPITLGVLALIAVVVFGLFGSAGHTSTFGLSQESDRIQLPDVALPSEPAGLLIGLICVGLAAWSYVLVSRNRSVPVLLLALFGLFFVVGFLVWAISGEQISLVGLLKGSLFLAVPLIFGSLSGILCERAGVINIAIEGQLLAGAFLSAVLGSLTGNIWIGLIAAPIAGLLVSWLLAVFAIKYFVDQVILGVVINVLVIGLTSFLHSQVLSPNADTWNSPPIFQPIKIPVLGDIPVIGPVLFDQNIVVYLMYLIVAWVHIALFRTRWGLRVRSVGEHPKAADTVGVKVNSVRFRNVLLGGLVAGLGGAAFTLASVGAFDKEMTAGKGFIALAAVIFGRWTPLGALGAALLFGFADNLQSILGIVGTPIPSEFMLMAPYLVTIFAVAGLVGRVRAPAADGIPYVKS
jgi:general nucleoside transport system permease protein